jgi:hypothetical protein
MLRARSRGYDFLGSQRVMGAPVGSLTAEKVVSRLVEYLTIRFCINGEWGGLSRAARIIVSNGHRRSYPGPILSGTIVSQRSVSR